MEKSVVDFERRDEIGLITLNNPEQAQRALARGAGPIDRAAGRGRSRGRDQVRDPAGRRARCSAPGTICARSSTRATPSASRCSRLCTQDHANDSRSVAAGDRRGAGHGHGGRLPVGRHLRPGRGGRRGQLRHAGHQDRSVLLHAGRGPVARRRARRRRWKCCSPPSPISAREAERIGLVNRVVPREQLAEATLQLAQQIAAASPYTLGLGKRAFYEQLGFDVEHGLSGHRANHGRKRPRARRHRGNEGISGAPAAAVGRELKARLVPAVFWP